MTITKSEAFQQATTLGCCKSDQISTDCGSSMEDLEEDSVALHEISANNNDAELKEKFSFPKRESVDIEFKDLRYTPRTFNINKFKFGEFLQENYLKINLIFW